MSSGACERPSERTNENSSIVSKRVRSSSGKASWWAKGPVLFTSISLSLYAMCVGRLVGSLAMRLLPQRVSSGYWLFFSWLGLVLSHAVQQINSIKGSVSPFVRQCLLPKFPSIIHVVDREHMLWQGGFSQQIFRCVLASLQEGMSVRLSVRSSVTHELKPCKSAVFD